MNIKQIVVFCKFIVIYFITFCFTIAADCNPYIVIKESETDPRYLFASPPGMILDKNGNIYLLDPLDGYMRKYDKNGKYISRFGRKGRGPGEFAYAVPVSIIDNYLYIWDLTRVHIYTLQGEFIQTFQHNYIIREPLYMKSGGYIGSSLKLKNGKFFKHLKIFRDKKEKILLTIDYHKFQKRSLIYGYSKSIASTRFLQRFIYKRDSNDRALYARTDRFQIWQYKNNKSSLLISEKIPLLPLVSEKIKEEGRRYEDEKNARDGETHWTVPVLEYWPAIMGFDIDQDDKIWVYVKNKKRCGFVKYSSDGKFLRYYKYDFTKSIFLKYNWLHFYFFVRDNMVYYKIYDSLKGVEIFKLKLR